MHLINDSTELNGSGDSTLMYTSSYTLAEALCIQQSYFQNEISQGPDALYESSYGAVGARNL